MPEEVIDATLTTAIEKAVETHKDIPQDVSNIKVQQEEQEEETKEEEKKEDQEQVPDEETENARTLIQALKDPQRAPLVIDFIARQAGYTKANVQTPQDAKEAKGEIIDILEKSLGEEFKFLAPKLAPAIKESVEALLQGRDQNSDLRARIEKQELKDIQGETARTHVALAQEWFGSDDMPDNVVKALSAAIDEFPPSDPNISPERYYRKMFSLAVGELGLTKKSSSSRSDRVARNRGDEVARNLSSQNRGLSPTVDGSSPRRLSLKDAVSLAIEQVDQASRK